MNGKLSTDPYKGVRDFYPEDMAVQNHIFSVWRKVSEQCGYQEYSASLLEYADLYRSKGSDEIVNEQMYIFKDKGDREVALRPEMTPTLARMIAAKRKALKFPLRWYSIPNVFRYERSQRGRRREHWQLNCDLMGYPDWSDVKSRIEEEVEIIELAYKIMTTFGAKETDFVIKIGSKDSLISELIHRRIPTDNHKMIARLIDQKGKMSEEERLTELKKLDGVFQIKESPDIAEIRRQLKNKGITNTEFDYYTGMVFEVFDTNPENRRSLFGGGRYDNLLEMFGVDPVPTVGFGMGDVTIKDFLVTHHLPLTN